MSNYLRIAAVLLVVSAMMPLAASANEEVGATGFSAADSRRMETLPIDPKITDPNAAPQHPMDSSFGVHLVWPVDRSLSPGSVRKSMLYLFLPATGSPPSDYLLIQQEAVDLGYHVIGLAYPNKDAVVAKCNVLSDYNDRQACYLSVRLRTLDGTTDSCCTTVDGTNSIDNRLTKLLVYLKENYPSEGWGGFLDDTGSPQWSRIVVAGHSQGGGNAALIGKLHSVARVVMISSPPDGCFPQDDLPKQQLPGCENPVGTPFAGAQWTKLPSLTPADRYYGLAHQSEFAITPMLANWGRQLDPVSGKWINVGGLGLFPFGTPVAPETNAPPYACTHMLLTSLSPAPNQAGVPALQNHRLTARDIYTPTDRITGLPLLRDAWRYISAVSPGSGSGCNSGM
jgi:pimeloyl-ACP methyl ester carboxylesterase